MIKKSQLLRKLFTEPRTIRVMGAHNGLGARLIERNGFDAIWSSGFEISTANALPDANLLTMTDNLYAAQAINESTRLPVICDCDTGYGNVNNVIHMIKKYEAVGLSAVVIEDKRFPKVNSFLPYRQDLADINEFAGKIKAAKNAQRDPDFMVIARVEALIAGWGVDEALRRARRYEQAGADAIVIHSKAKTSDEVIAFASRWKSSLPLIAIPTTYPTISTNDLYARGFHMVIYANQGLRASIRAMNETFRSILQTGSSALVEEKIASLEEVFEIQGMKTFQEEEEKFSGQEPITAIIPAAGDHRVGSDLGELLHEKPLCMLTIGGKTLLNRQTDILRSVGVRNTCVIGGYQHDKIVQQGAHIIHNPVYQQHQTAHSFFMARSYFGNRCLMLYSDILFDQQILKRLLKSPYDITLVIDRAYQSLPPRDKKLDLVIAENPEAIARQLDYNVFKPIRQIGKSVEKQQANYEFIGMAFFRNLGIQQLLEYWDRACKTFNGKAFYEAPSVEMANMTDVIQYLIDQQVPVCGMEIEHGWSEVHCVEDSERLNTYFQSSAGVLN